MSSGVLEIAKDAALKKKFFKAAGILTVEQRVAKLEREMTALRDVPQGTRLAPAQLVIKQTSLAFTLPAAALLGNSRFHDVTVARWAAMWVMRDLLQFSYARIGNLMGGKCHKAVQHAHKTLADLMEQDMVLCSKVLNLRDAVAAQIAKEIR